MSSQTLLMKFKNKDTPSTVTRGPVNAMAETPGFNETQLIHCAPAKQCEQDLASMPEPAPDLSASALTDIRKRFEASETGYRSTRSLLDGL